MRKFANKIRIYQKTFFSSETPRKTMASLFGIAIIVAVGMLALGQFSMQTVYAKNSKVVTIYEGNMEKVIVTRGQTVGDALEDAGVKIAKNDQVKPRPSEKLIDSYTVVNVDRARIITVTDGKKTARVLTSAQSDQEIAKDSNIPMLSEDIAKLSQVSPSNVVENDGAGLELKITRAKSVDLTLYGQKATVRTQKNTVADLHDQLGIKMSASDTINVQKNSQIYDGMNLQIWRNGIQTIQSEEDVAFDTQKVSDNTKSVGYDQIQTPGQNGKKTVIYQINMQDGQEVSRTKISEIVTVQPVSQVEIIGTKVVLPPGSHTDWMAMAGISPGDYGYVEYIISHESGWRYNAQNPSGAYGLPQALPGSKMASAGADWATNPITQLRWASSYVSGRYYPGSPYMKGISCVSRGWECSFRYWQNYRNY